MIKGSILKISKRIGGDNARDALYAIDNGDFEKAIEITLKYYDKTYMYGIRRKPARNLIFIETDSDDIDYNAKKVLAAANKMTC